jgi:hypothetical protein
MFALLVLLLSFVLSSMGRTDRRRRKDDQSPLTILKYAAVGMARAMAF